MLLSIVVSVLNVDAQDSEDYDIKRHFPEAIAFLDDVKRARGRSLVHCNLGVNRSGAVVAAYLMVSERRTLLDVVQYLRSKRSLILANKGFRRQLVAFARERRLLDPVIVVDDGLSPLNCRCFFTPAITCAPNVRRLHARKITYACYARWLVM